MIAHFSTQLPYGPHGGTSAWPDATIAGLRFWLPVRARGGGPPRPAGPLTCPRGGHTGPPRLRPGAGPSFARLTCTACGSFLRWLPKPRPAGSEVRHG